MTDLAYLSATEALARFRDRTLSPVELAQALIDRAAVVEPTVNALCVTYFDEALEGARAAEARYMGRGEAPRALEGLCVGIKDEVPIAGQPCSMGSLLHRDEIADVTDPMAERILAAGGIAHARTTTPEFSTAGFTHSRLWGVTRNPWNPEFGVGGSSGGTGASLASGTSTLATGSDIGGSIRTPAAWNGVVGFKAPYGRVPQLPPFNMDIYCHNGPLARTIADCALFENVIAGPHPADAAAIAPKYELPETFEGIAGMRIALCVQPDGWPVDDDVAAAIREAAATLEACGATVEEVEMPGFGPAHTMALADAHYGQLMGPALAPAMEHRDQLCAYTIAVYDESAGMTPARILEGVTGETKLHADLEDIHATYDALLWPTCASRGLIAGDDYVGHTLEIGGVTVPHYYWSCMTIPFNICSRNPVLVVPAGFASNGVPVGMQIVGRRYDDVTPFRIGAALEQVRPWLDAPERRPLQERVTVTGDLVPQIELSADEESARAARFPVGAQITFDDLTEHARIGALDRLREAEPVSWVPALGGWLVTSWELARSVLGRRDAFSVWAEPNLVRASLGVMMLTSQGDAHTRQRAPFDAPFRMRAVRERFGEPIAARTDALLAELRPAGACELASAFAGPFAVEVAADVLGLGLADVGQIMAFYQAFAGAMVYDGDPEPQRLADAARAELNALLHAELARVRATPDGSVTAAVANTPGDLDDDEIVAQLRVVLFGAIETIESLVVNTMALLLQHPEQLALVREQPDLLPNALEESMRLVTPVAFMERWTTQPGTAIGDVLLGRGEFVGVSSLAASRDPAVFDDPARFDVTRHNARRHLSFSYGEHHCLGFHLARLQGAIAIGALLDGLPGLRLVAAADPVGFAFRKVPELHVAWG